MQNDKNIPILNCIIIDKINTDTYKVEVECPSGKIHTHGLSKNELEKESHRIDHCSYCKNGYNLYLSKEEVLKWNHYKQNK